MPAFMFCSFAVITFLSLEGNTVRMQERRDWVFRSNKSKIVFCNSVWHIGTVTIIKFVSSCIGFYFIKTAAALGTSSVYI